MHKGQSSAEQLVKGLGRRGFLNAAVALGVGVVTAEAATSCSHGSTLSENTVFQEKNPESSDPLDFASSTILNPHKGKISGKHYLPSETDDVLWGYVPSIHSRPAISIKSGETITIDGVSHEGILEDQGRDPLNYFGKYGVKDNRVLEDARHIAKNYSRTKRDFKQDGPHVITGPVFVEGAQPGDVLKIETLELLPRVPYGVISSRHGAGCLALTPSLTAPPGISLEEVLPPTQTDNRQSQNLTSYGNVSTFVTVEEGLGTIKSNSVTVKFPLNPFMGVLGVAFSQNSELKDRAAHSVPPTLGGGNIDIRHLGVKSTFYVPVFTEGALFYIGDPHLAMGDGEVALTAFEGSLRGTFRLTVCKKGSGDAPSVAFYYPFVETPEAWIPLGLSDPDGLTGGQNSDLNIAMRRAVINALDFLENDRGMDRMAAYAYLSAAANFAVSQVVDRTVGIHGVINKSHFG